MNEGYNTAVSIHQTQISEQLNIMVESDIRTTRATARLKVLDGLIGIFDGLEKL